MQSMSIKTLRETIRQILREEAGPGKLDELVGEIQEINSRINEHYAGENLRPEDLPRMGVMIQTQADQVSIMFAVSNITHSGDMSPGKIFELSSSMHVKALDDLFGTEIPYGRIEIGPVENAECAGAWNVIVTRNTKSGWGPLLYDVAIEEASSRAGGLTSDRGEVSDDALRVWTAYDTSRGDVEKVQLDLTDFDIARWRDSVPNLAHITPKIKWDDCFMYSAFDERLAAKDFSASKSGNWVKSPLSRAYKKPSVIINQLQSLGLLFRKY